MIQLILSLNRLMIDKRGSVFNNTISTVELLFFCLTSSAMGYGIGSYVTKLANDINFCHVEGCWRWAFRVSGCWSFRRFLYFSESRRW